MGTPSPGLITCTLKQSHSVAPFFERDPLLTTLQIHSASERGPVSSLMVLAIRILVERKLAKYTCGRQAVEHQTGASSDVPCT